MRKAWDNVQLELAALLQEFKVILEEMRVAPDRERRVQLYDLGQACVCKYQEVLRRYQAMIETTRSGPG